MEERRTTQSQELAGHSRKRRRGRGGAVRGVLTALLTLVLVGCCTTAMLFGIFMKYVNTSLLPTLDVNADDYTMAQSSVVYYQDNNGYLVPVMREMPLQDGIARATLAMMVSSPHNDMEAARLGLRTVMPEGTDIDLDGSATSATSY